MKNMLKDNMLQLIAKVAEVESNVVCYGWPPPCMGFIYQPKRPKRKDKEIIENGGN